jgi:hypothetical protein
MVVAAAAGWFGTSTPASAEVATGGAVVFEPSPAEQGREMFLEGVNLYETSDYQGAIEKFTQAYGFSR